MDYNYDKLLQQLEQEIDQIRLNFKQDEKQILVREIDKQLGGFYGSLELRDGLKEAHAKMNAVVAALKRVREFVRSQFVRLQIEQLQENVTLLQKVFNERMELPDSDEFFNEMLSDAGNPERSTNPSTSSRESTEPSKTTSK
ncbi:unnamed protein product [Angiostrongylus costaricensis]|uniref:Biogenesis of lysosome-related organelles complex 1 subunit KXD1 n=1 Tax=Angiostrongylus costaricensis TaxID=334426 RepID=A0A0R3PJ64_ANGCS|nr:unnamed protein product [Angiostrongylus costaricensis]